MVTAEQNVDLWPKDLEHGLGDPTMLFQDLLQEHGKASVVLDQISREMMGSVSAIGNLVTIDPLQFLRKLGGTRNGDVRLVAEMCVQSVLTPWELPHVITNKGRQSCADDNPDTERRAFFVAIVVCVVDSVID